MTPRDRSAAALSMEPIRPLATVLRTIARERDGYLGVYGATVEPGHVVVDDPVTLPVSPS